MSDWQGWLFTTIAQVTVVSLAVLVLVACRRRRVALRHTIGVVGLLLILGSPCFALVLPHSTWWRIPFSGSTRPPLDETRRSVSAEDVPAIGTSATVHSDEAKAIDDSALTSRSSRALVASEPDPRGDLAARTIIEGAAGVRDRRMPWDFLGVIAGLVWLLGSVASAAVWMRQHMRLHRLARSLEPVQLRCLPGETSCAFESNDGFESIAREACQEVGLVKVPSIAVSDLVPMPLVFGVWSPVIVIPVELLQSGAESQLREVLIHEAAHIVRRDMWICVVQRLATVLWWWHPGVLWLNRAIARSREEVCDNYVLSHGDAAHYAQTLLELAEKCTRVKRLAAALGVLDFRWTLELRIKGLLKPGRDVMTRTERRPAAVSAVLLGAVCLFIGGGQAVERDKASEGKAAATQAAGSRAKTSPSAELRKIIVQGQCTDDKSQPLAGVRVVIVRCAADYRSQTIAGETKSDATGRFEFRDIETALPDRRDLAVAAALPGHASACVPLADHRDGVVEAKVTLSSDPGTLSGVVSDRDGRPIPGVTVYVSCFLNEPLPGIRSAVTDERGRYAITDLVRWTTESTRTFDPKTKTGHIVTSCSFHLRHPDYPTTTAQHSAVPQEVNVTLDPPAVVEGRVLDAVTNKPAAHVTVSAQGVARRGWYQTEADAEGRYRLLMTRDHYNIWADTDDRIAVAVKAIKAEPGHAAAGNDIRLVRGGYVVGTVIGPDGKPVSPTKDAPSWVAHYGPARPRTGAAVTSTLVQPDGTYRLRVAPGRNFVYCMSGEGTAGEVEVEEGHETRFDIRLGERPRYQPETADERLARKIRKAAEEEDAELAIQGAKPSARPESAVTKPISLKRPDTPAGKLLDELAEQNAGNDRFHDVWCRTLKGIVDLGPVAVPDLIAELDATKSDMMLRCLGFMLRAIGDKRAVPALIRAIPKTLLRPGSDMGLTAEDQAVATFMQKHAVWGRDEGMSYSFSRPIGEIFGALKKLTGQSFDEEQLFHVFSGGSPHQQRLKQELFARTARKWAAWWEQHWSEHVRDAAYSHVNLTVPEPSVARETKATLGRHVNSEGTSAGWILEPYTNPKARTVLYDLDTGRAAGLPEKWRKLNDIESHFGEIEAWGIHEGFDLLGTEWVSPDDNRRHFAIRGLGLQAWELGKARWKMAPSDATIDNLKAEGSATAGLLMHYDRKTERFDPKETAPFLFTTREETVGLLFVGVEVHDDSLKPGGVLHGDDELKPVAFVKGRRCAWTLLEGLP